MRRTSNTPAIIEYDSKRLQRAQITKHHEWETWLRYWWSPVAYQCFIYVRVLVNWGYIYRDLGSFCRGWKTFSCPRLLNISLPLTFYQFQAVSTCKKSIRIILIVRRMPCGAFEQHFLCSNSWKGFWGFSELGMQKPVAYRSFAYWALVRSGPSVCIHGVSQHKETCACKQPNKLSVT